MKITRYTGYISKNGNDKIVGSYLFETEYGIIPKEIVSSELGFIASFPEIDKKLSDRNIIQFYRDGYFMKTELGKLKTEGPYCEQEYFSVVSESYGDTLREAMSNLNHDIKKDSSNIQKRKAYSLGGKRYE